MAENKQERRYRRTEALILDGFTKLLQEKSVKEITVRELSELIDINRSTFYLHYSDIYDLLEKTEQRLLEQLEESVKKEWETDAEPNPDHFYNFLRDVFHILSENAALCSALIGPRGDIAFLRTVEKLLFARGTQTLQSFAPVGLQENDIAYATSFALAGCLGIVENWLMKGCPESAEHMAELTFVMLREGTASLRISNIK